MPYVNIIYDAPAEPNRKQYVTIHIWTNLIQAYLREREREREREIFLFYPSPKGRAGVNLYPVLSEKLTQTAKCSDFFEEHIIKIKNYRHR
jgi:CRISPR/Cas system-associated exonuclease Cas4 (RecB family)